MQLKELSNLPHLFSPFTFLFFFSLSFLHSRPLSHPFSTYPSMSARFSLLISLWLQTKVYQTQTESSTKTAPADSFWLENESLVSRERKVAKRNHKLFGYTSVQTTRILWNKIHNFKSKIHPGIPLANPWSCVWTQTDQIFAISGIVCWIFFVVIWLPAK